MSKYTTGLGVAIVSLAAAIGIAYAQTSTTQPSGGTTDPAAQQPQGGSTTAPSAGSTTDSTATASSGPSSAA